MVLVGTVVESMFIVSSAYETITERVLEFLFLALVAIVGVGDCGKRTF